MSRHLDRLHRGERWWAAEIALRGSGLLLFDAAYRIALLIQRMLVAPRHPVTAGEFALCAAVVALLTSGLALTFEGPGLFRFVAIPRKSAYF